MLEKYPSSTGKELILSPASSPVGGYRTYVPEKELTIHGLWQLLGRRRAYRDRCSSRFRRGQTLLHCTFATRRYEATGEVQVQKEQSAALGLDSGNGQADTSDALQDNMTLQTQAKAFFSPTLLLLAGNRGPQP